MEPTVHHLNHHHRDTLRHLFTHPTSHNIQWHDVVALLEAIGSVEERHTDKVTVTVGGEVETLERPKHKDCSIELVVELRHLLDRAGFGPSAEGTALH